LRIATQRLGAGARIIACLSGCHTLNG
jgi:hypothetical protein